MLRFLAEGLSHKGLRDVESFTMLHATDGLSVLIQSAGEARLEAFSQTLERDMGRPLPFADLVERFLTIAEAG